MAKDTKMESAQPTGARPSGRGRLAARQKLIGQGLQRLFDGVVSEPVPDEFLDLLNKLDNLEGQEKEPLPAENTKDAAGATDKGGTER